MHWYGDVGERLFSVFGRLIFFVVVIVVVSIALVSLFPLFLLNIFSPPELHRQALAPASVTAAGTLRYRVHALPHALRSCTQTANDLASFATRSALAPVRALLPPIAPAAPISSCQLRVAWPAVL